MPATLAIARSIQWVAHAAAGACVRLTISATCFGGTHHSRRRGPGAKQPIDAFVHEPLLPAPD
ncbi:hypothetical protein D3227_38470 [Mesorhizobium waimense]|uniref:Uncharacterized protein n=1 Tax=Mesorhizobium waimense TaxID=1300307 RepID=A0A3A5JZ80_9HYPH|nr:hypothetical protein D3227_38470 [Mesorhizobium waimense]